MPQAGSGTTMREQHDDRWEVPPGFGQTLGAPELGPGSTAEPATGRGKGPKNWKRRDELVREDVCEALTDSDLDASDVEVAVLDGEVTLSGTVLDRATKHDLEDLVYEIRGVTQVHSRLAIRA